MTSTVNLINNNSNVNKQKEEKEPFFIVPSRAYSELFNQRPTLFKLLVCLLAEYTTFKYGIVGVHSEVTMKQVANDTGIHLQNIGRELRRLEQLGFIKIFNTAPLLIQVLELPSVTPLKGIYEFLGTVRANKKDFNFFPKWENRFNKIFSKQYADIDQGVIDLDPDDLFGYSATTA